MFPAQIVTSTRFHLKTHYQSDVDNGPILGSISITIYKSTSRVHVQGSSYLLWLEEHYPIISKQVGTLALKKSLPLEISRSYSARVSLQNTLTSSDSDSTTMALTMGEEVTAAQDITPIDQYGGNTSTANDLETLQPQDDTNTSGSTVLLSVLECDGPTHHVQVDTTLDDGESHSLLDIPHETIRVFNDTMETIDSPENRKEESSSTLSPSNENVTIKEVTKDKSTRGRKITRSKMTKVTF